MKKLFGNSSTIGLINNLFLTPKIDDLIQVMYIFKIPFREWCQPENKTIEQLYQEILSKETEITLTEEGLVRKIRCLRMFIYDLDRDKVLVEGRQVLPNGKVRVLNRVPGEKMIRGEKPEQALARGLLEELHLKPKEYDFKLRQVMNRTRISASYPGLVTTEDIFSYKVELSDDALLPHNLEFNDKDGKVLFFHWEEHTCLLYTSPSPRDS